MERHLDHVSSWMNKTELFETYRSKRKAGANRILGPKRTLIQLQNRYRESILPDELKAQIHQQCQNFERKHFSQIQKQVDAP